MRGTGPKDNNQLSENERMFPEQEKRKKAGVPKERRKQEAMVMPMEAEDRKLIELPYRVC